MVKGFVEKIAKAVLKIIMPDVTEQLLRVFKLDKLVDYMELPNEADRKVEKLEENHKMITKQLSEMDKALDKVKKLRSL